MKKLIAVIAAIIFAITDVFAGTIFEVTDSTTSINVPFKSTQRIVAPLGAETTPSFTFTGNRADGTNGTGMWSDSAGKLWFTAGAGAMVLDYTGVLPWPVMRMVDRGSAAYPTITITDGMAGLFSPAARKLAVSIYQSESMRWIEDEVLIATTTAQGVRFSVNGVINSMTGGFKFPDGTTQTTAAGAPYTGCADHGALSSAPGSPTECARYYNTTTKQMYMWNGISWVILG